MNENVLSLLILLSAVGCGLNAGLFFVFSNTIMRALGRLKPDAGIAAMQSINQVILNPMFFTIFFGTAVTALVLAIAALGGWVSVGKMYLLAGSFFYLGGCILVTIACNVPLNDALDHVEPRSTAGAELWTRYLKTWTAWNHVRTVACLMGMVAFSLVK